MKPFSNSRIKKNMLLGIAFTILLFSFTPVYATISTWNITGTDFIIMHDDIDSYTWQEAQDWGMNNLGGNLASITSNSEQNDISTGLNNVGVGSDQVWIGGKRIGVCSNASDGTAAAWEWISGDTWSFTNWNVGSPNSCSQECTRLLGVSHEWDDNGCSNSLNWAVFLVVGLPIELKKFEAKAINSESIELKWQTLSEINNKGFNIEHSTNGENWKEIGYISGMGTTFDLQDYTFLDQNPKNGENYYRLKQEDFDSSFEYSNIVSISINKNIPISVFPNPTNGKIKFSIHPSEFANVKIMNTNGSIIVNQFLESQSIDISDLPNGIYFILIEHENQFTYKRIIKQ
jgi:hypothetical protein